MVSSSLENATLFTTFDYMKRIQHVKPDNSNFTFGKFILCANTAAIVTAHVLTPLELLKCRMQMLQSARDRGIKVKYKSPLDVLIRVYKEEGIRGIYRGNTATLCREIPGHVAWFGMYELITQHFLQPGQTKKDLKPWQIMIAGCVSGFSYWSMFYPADVVKSRMQTNMTKKKLTFVSVFKDIYTHEGVRGLYRGYLVTALRASYSNGFIFLAHHEVLRLLNYLDP